MGVFRVARFLCACLVGLLSFSVLTAEASRKKSVVRPSSAQDQFVKGGETLDIDRHWGEVIDIPQSQYSSSARVNVPVVEKSKFSPSRIAQGIKSVLKNNPVKIAVTSAGLYLIHQLPGANFDPVTGEPVKTPELVTTGYSWSAHINNATTQPTEKYSTNREACIRVVGAESSGNSWTLQVQENTTTQSTCKRQWNPAVCPSCGTQTIGYAFRSTLNCPNGIDFSTNTCRASPIVPVPLTDSELDQVVSHTPELTEQHWEELGPELMAEIPATFENPDEIFFDGPPSIDGEPTHYTTLDNVTGDTTVTESTPTYNFDYTSNPLSITTTTTNTTNTYQNGTHVSTTTITQSPPVTGVETAPQEQLEVPTDCDFMPTVCSFIDWVKTPFNEEEPDLSQFIADEDYTKDFNVNSNASCPAPATLETAFGSFELSYEPACMWAGMIKPFVLIAALISAIFISLGAIRGSD